MIQRVGDATSEIIAAAGEDLELECIATGANPPPTLAWFANGQAISTGHSQENKRQGENDRTWASFSRLILPVSKEDDGANVKCVVTHPALDEAMSAEKPLTIHCKYLVCFTLINEVFKDSNKKVIFLFLILEIETS